MAAPGVNPPQQTSAGSSLPPLQTAGPGIPFDTLRGEQKVQDASPKESSKLRCQFEDCKKSINPLYLSIHRCACQRVFCTTHKSSMLHQCTVDYKAQEQARLRQSFIEQLKSKSVSGDHGSHSNYSH